MTSLIKKIFLYITTFISIILFFVFSNPAVSMDGTSLWLTAIDSENVVIHTQTFTANGTWPLPAKLYGGAVWVTGIGGGGAGAGVGSGSNYASGGGSGLWKEKIIVTVSANVSVTVGSGGSGGTGDGSSGNDSSFGSLIFSGGTGGYKTTSITAPEGRGQSIGLTPSSVRGGMGGSTPWGLGGLGSTTGSSGGSASANTGAGGGGAGDGGGGSYNGGDGGSGIIIVEWLETL